MKRRKLIHLHIFKNAGSTIDHYIKRYFKNKLIQYDNLDDAQFQFGLETVDSWFEKKKNSLAFSTHQLRFTYQEMRFPNERGEYFYLAFLRHPIIRAYSVYNFEVNIQKKFPEKTSFQDYIESHFRVYPEVEASIFDGQSAYFSSPYSHSENKFVRLDPESSLNLAKKTISALDFLGCVDQMEQSLLNLNQCVSKIFPGLEFGDEILNRNTSLHINSVEEQVRKVLDSLPTCTRSMLIENNQVDLALYDYFKVLIFDKRLVNKGMPT